MMYAKAVKDLECRNVHQHEINDVQSVTQYTKPVHTLRVFLTERAQNFIAYTSAVNLTWNNDCKDE